MRGTGQLSSRWAASNVVQVEMVVMLVCIECKHTPYLIKSNSPGVLEIPTFGMSLI
jgi:hypothetical protein